METNSSIGGGFHGHLDLQRLVYPNGRVGGVRSEELVCNSVHGPLTPQAHDRILSSVVPIVLLGIMSSTFLSLISHITFTSASSLVWRRTLRHFIFSLLLRFFELPFIILYIR